MRALTESREVGGSEEDVGHKVRKGREHTWELRADIKDETNKVSRGWVAKSLKGQAGR